MFQMPCSFEREPELFLLQPWAKLCMGTRRIWAGTIYISPAEAQQPMHPEKKPEYFFQLILCYQLCTGRVKCFFWRMTLGKVRPPIDPDWLWPVLYPMVLHAHSEPRVAVCIQCWSIVPQQPALNRSQCDIYYCCWPKSCTTWGVRKSLFYSPKTLLNLYLTRKKIFGHLKWCRILSINCIIIICTLIPLT